MGPDVLGVESSCYGTLAGLVAGGRLLYHAVASSTDERARYGSAVPEISARAHVHSVLPVIRRVDVIVHAGAEPTPLELSIDPLASVEFAALHPMSAVSAQVA
ncbi:hypothetical protein ACFW93_11875 [Streptomyces canus]|uniref:hypothetical protein n=1 Tax=Streptomyces canus TaxID=58343 RepID=UPI0036B6F362